MKKKAIRRGELRQTGVQVVNLRHIVALRYKNAPTGILLN
jgi:hypothetical protein